MVPDCLASIHMTTNAPPSPTTVIRGKKMEIADTFEYLETIFDRRLRWDTNTQRLFLLLKLKYFSASFNFVYPYPLSFYCTLA